eukprot:scaffold14852_cov92-Skeletonema_marinoi.AAC.1
MEMKSLSSGIHPSIHYRKTYVNGSLEAVDCYIHSARYHVVVQCGGRGKPNWASSGHLRRCSMADTQIKSLSSDTYPSISVLQGSIQIGPHIMSPTMVMPLFKRQSRGSAIAPEDGVAALAPPKENEGVCFVSLDVEADMAGVFGCTAEPKEKEAVAVVS